MQELKYILLIYTAYVALILGDLNITSDDLVFLETFEGDWQSRWITSKNPEYTGKWAVEEAEKGFKSGKGLVVKSSLQRLAISAMFRKVLDNTNKDLIVQYEIKFQEREECGGSYLKLIAERTPPFKQAEFSDQSEYIIMFGPDVCGPRNKMFLIVCKEHHMAKQLEEKHFVYTSVQGKSDSFTHLYTLHIQTNNDVKIYIDQKLVSEGNLLNSFDPPLNPLKNIYDPDDIRPDNWDDREFIPDPKAVMPSDLEDVPMIPDPVASKPTDWIDAPRIPDPAAQKPLDWDNSKGEWKQPTIPNPKCANVENCGEWTPPLITNPKWKGRWKQPMIKNPDYKGAWQPRLIPNPYYEEDIHPHNFHKMVGVGFEIFTTTNGTMFDNILITHNKEVADAFAAKTWAVKYKKEIDHQEEEYARLTTVDNMEVVKAVFAEYPVAVFFTIVAVLFPIFFCCPTAGGAPPKKAVKLQ